MEKSENFENEEFGVILDPREQRRRLSLAIKEWLENLTVKSNHQKRQLFFKSHENLSAMAINYGS